MTEVFKRSQALKNKIKTLISVGTYLIDKNNNNNFEFSKCR